jgi:hypothetical protein
MRSLFTMSSALRLASYLVVLSVMTNATVMYAAPIVHNGGARHWVAFNPVGRNLGPVQFLQNTVLVVNTSTAPNAFTIFHEPAHVRYCSGTLAPGASILCGTQPTQRFIGGYFQAIAAEPVLIGGQNDVPVMEFAQQANGTFGANPSTGTILIVPLVWQEGCPPRRGSGCPDGSVTTGGTGTGGNTKAIK